MFIFSISFAARHPSRRWFPLLFLSALTLLCMSCTSSGPAQPAAGATPHTATSTPSPTALPATPLPDATALDAYMQQQVRQEEFNGSVLVAYHGNVFAKGYGLADRDAGVPNTPHTRFRIGSNSKQFTAMTILILQERGKLHVTDSVCRYVPDCPRDWQPITLANLLTHTSGIPDYTNFPDFAVTWTQPVTPTQLVARFKNLPLDFPPGTVFRYSNSGYVLLGYIIEQVTGESYATFLHEAIFAPLHLNDTGYDSTFPTLPEHATGYYRGYIKPDPYDMSVLYAAGALYSTVEDLYTWDQALLAHRLVSQRTIDTMFALHQPCPPPGSPGGCLMHADRGYGYGLFLADEPEGRLIYHVGRIDGFITFNGFFPQRDLFVVVLTNLETSDVLQIGRALAAQTVGGS